MKKLFLLCFILNVVYVNGQDKITVFFDFNQADLKALFKLKLTDRIAKDNLQVYKMEGYCDWKGTKEYNTNLSLKRVAEVRDFLQSEKVQFLDNAESIGFGEDFKQSKIQSENRKVVVYFNKKKEINFKERENDLADDVKLAKKGDLIVLKQMLFYNMSPVLKPSSRPILSELLTIMEQNPSLKIEIQGHICCEVRNEVIRNDGIELSTARARTVFDYLVQNNINQTRLSFKGFGNSRPLHPIPEKSELQQNENRRVEILIVEN